MTTRIPKTLRIGPHTYQLVHDPEVMDAAGAVGQAMVDSLLLLIDTRPAVGQQRETLLHEALHAIWALTGLSVTHPAEAADSVGEHIITVLSPYLLSLLRDNPRLVSFLTESAR